MPRFEPFRALRYATADLAAIVAPPYDVLSEADIDALQAGSPYNVTYVDVPRGGADRYERAAHTLAGWRREGALDRDREPSFTIYRLRFTDSRGRCRDIAGVLGGLEVVDEGAGGVLPHERTTSKASTDRLDLTRATHANLSPVWGLSLASGLTDLLAEPAEALAVVDDRGVRHIVERLTDPDRIAAIQAVLGSDDVLIADGHHRYGVSRTYRDEIRESTGRTDTAAEQTLTFVNELVAEQLSIDAIHRLYTGSSPEDLRQRLARRFELAAVDRPAPATLEAMEGAGFLVLYAGGRAWSLTPRPGAFEGIRELDGAWLEATLGGVDLQVDYQHGLDETVAAVEERRADAAVLIRPVSLAEIERTAREGLLMPPKSTFFTPKLKTGLVIRLLDET